MGGAKVDTVGEGYNDKKDKAPAKNILRAEKEVTWVISRCVKHQEKSMLFHYEGKIGEFPGNWRRHSADIRPQPNNKE